HEGDECDANGGSGSRSTGSGGSSSGRSSSGGSSSGGSSSGGSTNGGSSNGGSSSAGSGGGTNTGGSGSASSIPCENESDCDPGFNCDYQAGLCAPSDAETCEELGEAECGTRTDCEVIYAGVDCSCGAGCECQGGEPGCVCDSFEFFRCEALEN
ncbi:MAG: hypothetical protein KC492_03305, partial [Myxococcales bacterium]|nr:hypothetical protein [Myxococcales bacterium]